MCLTLAITFPPKAILKEKSWQSNEYDDNDDYNTIIIIVIIILRKKRENEKNHKKKKGVNLGNSKPYFVFLLLKIKKAEKDKIHAETGFTCNTNS